MSGQEGGNSPRKKYGRKRSHPSDKGETWPSLKQPSSLQKTSSMEQKIRFVLIKAATEGEDLKKVNPFTANRSITGCCGEPQSIKKLRNNTYLIECTKDAQATKLLNLTQLLDGTKVQVEAHGKLNQSKGVVSAPDLMTCSEELILEELKTQNVTEVKQIINKRENRPTPLFVLTFSTPFLPSSIKAGYLHLEVRPYVPAPLRCFTCLRFGHLTESCGIQAQVCRNCSKNNHPSTECPNMPACVNCFANNTRFDHSPMSPKCPTYQKEKRIKEIQVTKKIPHVEARKEFEKNEAPSFLISFAEKANKNKSIQLPEVPTVTNPQVNPFTPLVPPTNPQGTPNTPLPTPPAPVPPVPGPQGTNPPPGQGDAAAPQGALRPPTTGVTQQAGAAGAQPSQNSQALSQEARSSGPQAEQQPGDPALMDWTPVGPRRTYSRGKGSSRKTDLSGSSKNK